MDFGTILAMVVIFGFFYQRLETKIDKVELRLGQRIDKVEESLNQRIDKLKVRIDNVEEKLRKEMFSNTKEINSRIDSLYNFMYTLCGYKRDVLDRHDDNNKAA